MIKAEAKNAGDRKYRALITKLNRLAKNDGIVMTKLALDALVAPTDGPAWPPDYADGDHFTGGCSTPPLRGLSASVPAGYVFGLRR